MIQYVDRQRKNLHFLISSFSAFIVANRRARETAIAMGFAVDYELVTLTADDDLYAGMERSRWWEAAHLFTALGRLVATKGATWRYGHALVALWRDILTAIPDGSAALVIGHSGELEIALVACFPYADHTASGNPPALLMRQSFIGTMLSAVLRSLQDNAKGIRNGFLMPSLAC